ncbi:class I SAM-dependent methyltransferase [Suttonella sp. R2A3]|uniref:class I SAM-dependent methyltransferase n=1 Tax=Suttonella sp. R2A3 TaxID=2908648 RepID=UPI001F46F544|nr:class I SAM-dependent methyltransferase [Suttonella sp. R2A3]UJF24064.1 class I SAM-dependent methyltransferase [Suttonella sp. R2A3]
MWDQRFSGDEYVYGREPNDFLKAEYAHIPKGGRVLCLAEGEGRNAVFLAKLGYQVTGVDQSSVGLNKAQKLAAENGVTIITKISDLADYDLGDNAWDGIVSIFAHVPPKVRQDLHQRAIRGLKKDGVFLLEAYTERQLTMSGVGGPPAENKDYLMSLADLKEELKDLEFIIGAEVERTINEGTNHYGESAVVQVVARKD